MRINEIQFKDLTKTTLLAVTTVVEGNEGMHSRAAKLRRREREAKTYFLLKNYMPIKI